MEQPPHRERQPTQWFQFGGWVFDIDRAQALVAEHPREPQPLPVMPWVRQYGLDLLDHPETAPILGVGPGFNRDYAMTTELSDPVIVATLRTSDHAHSPLLIDGTHRLYHAFREGLAELPAYVLDEHETQIIRIDGLGPRITE